MKQTPYQTPINKTSIPGVIVKKWKQELLTHNKKMPSDIRSLGDNQKLKWLINSEHGSVHDLWEAFTTDRDLLPRYLMNPKKQALSYLLGFHLPNIARFQMVFERLSERYMWRDFWKSIKSAPTFIDFGCGSGAMSISWLSAIYRAGYKGPTHLSLFDHQAALLDMARRNIDALPFQTTIRSGKVDLTKAISYVDKNLNKIEGVTNISLGYIWNEISNNHRAQHKLIELLGKLESKETILWIFEPANQNQSRKAMELRDQLISMGYELAYPCSHSSQCPMLERSRDWCYSEGHWQRPIEIELLDKRLKLDRSKLRTTTMILMSPKVKAKLADLKRNSDQIIVGKPLKELKSNLPKKLRARLKEKKKFDYLLCGPKGISKVTPIHPEKSCMSRGEVLDFE